MSKKRIAELDGLRGVAALAVILYHFTFRFGEKFNIQIITDKINFQYGHYGVELFFIISGFVIFMSIKNIESPSEFVYKRFIRLFPVFWISVFFSFLYVSFFGPELLKVNFKELIINLTMFPSLFNVKSVDGVYWTLKIEMFFYAIILLLLLLRKTNKVKELGFIYILLGFMLASFLRIPIYFYYGSLFLLGINFYKIWSVGAEWWNHIQIFLVVILAYFCSGLEVLIVTTLLVVVFYLLVYNKLNFLALKPFIFFGKISYAFYLIHQNIGHSIQLSLISNSITNIYILIVVPFFFTLILATVITFFLEDKIALVFKRRYGVGIPNNVVK